MNEGLRPYWYDSSAATLKGVGNFFTLRFYYPADIDSITLYNRITGRSVVILVEKEGKYLYVRSGMPGVLRTGEFNSGNTVIYDQRQENPIYSNRISGR